MISNRSAAFTISLLATLAAAGAQASESSEHLRSCDTPWEHHGVSEATIFYGIDAIFPPEQGPIFDMAAERNTSAYRQRAFDFFAERFGVTFDVNSPGVQLAVDREGRTATMQPIQLGADTSHQVYGIDAQRIPQWRHRLPMTSAALRDDGYFTFVGEEGFRVHGTYGGEDGVELPPGSVFLLGEYRMFDGDDQLIDTLRYRSTQPAFAVVDPGAALPTQLVTITCEVQSDLFGDGKVQALGTQIALADGSADWDFRYTLRFPSRISDASLRRPRCKQIRARTGIDGP